MRDKNSNGEQDTAAATAMAVAAAQVAVAENAAAEAAVEAAAEAQAAAARPQIPDDVIAVRAFHKWQARGCPIGDDASDWFAAREELEAELGGD